MALRFEKLHKHFVAEVSPIDLRRVHDPGTLAEIRRGMDEHAILVFHDQPLTDQEHLDFAQRLDGALHTKLGSAAIVNIPVSFDTVVRMSLVCSFLISTVTPGIRRP